MSCQLMPQQKTTSRMNGFDAIQACTLACYVWMHLISDQGLENKIVGQTFRKQFY